MRHATALLSIAVLAIVVLPGPAAWAAERKYPLEPSDTSSPQATLYSFLTACDEIYELVRTRGRGAKSDPKAMAIVERGLRCLDLSEEPAYLRDHVAAESLVCLKEVLDRIDLPPRPSRRGTRLVQRAAIKELPDRWVIPHTEIAIAKVTEGPRKGEYLFSPSTVARATEFYERVKYLPYKPWASKGFYNWFLTEPGSPALAAIVHRLPDWARQRVNGQAVWQWVGLVVTIVGALLVMFLVYRTGRWVAHHTRESSVFRYCLTLVFPVTAMLVPLLGRKFIVDYLVISGKTLVIVEFSTNVVFLLALLVVLVGAGSRIAEAIVASPRINPKGIDAQFIRLISRVLSIVAAIVVFLEGGKFLGIPLTTLLAGAGVGGLTVALAAQDSLKNFFGSMMIILDKPYRVGERIAVKDYDGVVEEIGLRSTKLRLLTGHLASIPNEEMARSDIENISRRPHIRRIEDLAVPLDTPPGKVEQGLNIIRELLQDHEGMDAEFPPRVYCTHYNRDSLNLRIIYWYHPPNYWDFLAFSEKLNLDIKRKFEAAAIRFALPSTTTYLKSTDPATPTPLEEPRMPERATAIHH